MNYILTIVVFVIIFSVLILIHELGHFVMAKRAGIKVEEFGFGLPPRLWGKKKGETIYSINWIPFGGFVRMLGEDATDPSMLKKKRSFVAQPMRARVQVIVAGVVMNFFLAWLLLTIGFSIGMQPLLGPDDILTAVDEGVIHMTEGVKIKEVEDGSFAEEVGFMEEDLIYSIDGNIVDAHTFGGIVQGIEGEYKVMRDGGMSLVSIPKEKVGENKEMGITFYDYASFPRVKIFDIFTGSSAYKAGLRADDVIVSVNGHQVYEVLGLEELVRGEGEVEYEIYRDGQRQSIKVYAEEATQVLISDVLPGTPAEGAGFMSRDIIVAINGNNISGAEEVVGAVSSVEDGAKMSYMVDRGGERILLEVVPDEGRVGIMLSELVSYAGVQNLTLYNADSLSSILEIENQQFPVHLAAYEAFHESVRLAALTGKMFVGFVKGLVASGEVPDSVAGPIGIAQLTHVFVQEGAIPVLRFVAILSLSLAVINILPFPALDGGRLLFVLIELVIGRKIDQRWEAMVHMFGYVLILLLILAVTYSDILRLIG